MTPTRGSSWRELCAIAAATFAWLAATAWARPLTLPDEGRYVGVAWEMLRSGDWLTPTLNGLPYFHKPPLFYWITAAAMSVFGAHQEAARAASLVGAWLGACALYLFVRRWAGPRTARLTLMALLVQPLFYIGGQFANLDMLVAGCITATVLLLAHAALCLEGGLPHRQTLAWAYAAAALGMLAKGLIGVVLPALVIAIWLLARRRGRVLVALLWWPGALVFAAVASPWLLAMQWRFGGFADYFFLEQQFRRFATSGFNNAEPFWFYPAVLALFSLPWLPWLRALATRGYLADPGRGPLRLLMLLWVGVVVGFFSLPQSKLIGYVLPAIAPLAFLMADGYQRLTQPSPRATRLWWASMCLAAVPSVGAVAALAVHPLPSSRELAAALTQQRQPDEPVFMLNHYAFDLPFYARLLQPVVVVDDWTSDDVGRHDNWRKELADAGRFAPLQASRTLIEPTSLRAAACHSPVSWWLGPSASNPRYPWLDQARSVVTQHGTTLWRVDTGQAKVFNALRCAETPSGGSANK